MDQESKLYGENSIEHMLGGKAIARALRGHILVESALTIKLMLFNEEAQEYLTIKKREVEEIEMAISSRQDVQDVVDMDIMKTLDAYLEKLKEHLYKLNQEPQSCGYST